MEADRNKSTGYTSLCDNVTTVQLIIISVLRGENDVAVQPYELTFNVFHVNTVISYIHRDTNRYFMEEK